MCVRTYIETTERYRLDPLLNTTCNFCMPPDKRNEDYGDDNSDDGDADINGNENECDGDVRRKK